MMFGRVGVSRFDVFEILFSVSSQKLECAGLSEVGHASVAAYISDMAYFCTMKFHINFYMVELLKSLPQRIIESIGRILSLNICLHLLRCTYLIYET